MVSQRVPYPADRQWLLDGPEWHAQINWKETRQSVENLNYWYLDVCVCENWDKFSRINKELITIRNS